MLTPSAILELVLAHYAKEDCQISYVAELILDGFEAGGYVILKRDSYLDSLAHHASATIKQPVTLFRSVVADSVMREMGE